MIKWIGLIPMFIYFCYLVRHIIFTYSRVTIPQKISYADLFDSDLPKVSILLPMHNEETVADRTLVSLIESEQLFPVVNEIIAINDHSTDKTGKILDEWKTRFPELVQVVHRNSGTRGKPAALNAGMEFVTGDVILIFDADYTPPKGLVRNLSVAFKDPSVGSVMGRVIPVNENQNMLTSLIAMERQSGYQIEQQARFHLGLLVQYGGTVGGIRRNVLEKLGGFDHAMLAEDTDISIKLFTRGWNIHYSNICECYEEAPETWKSRGGQIERWSRGHNRVMLSHFKRVILSPFLTLWQKIDSCLLLMMYAVPVIFFLTLLSSIYCYASGSYFLSGFYTFALTLMAISGLGHFSPFFQVTAACIIDGTLGRVRKLPLLMLSFFFSAFYSVKGFLFAIRDHFSQNTGPKWRKTQRVQKRSYF